MVLYQLVLAVWALLLCRLAGQEEVVVGSPYDGRDAAGTEALIGYFVNMLALRVEVPRGVAGAAAAVRGVAGAAAAAREGGGCNIPRRRRRSLLAMPSPAVPLRRK